MMIDDGIATTIYNRRRQAAEPKGSEGEGAQGCPPVPPWSAQGAEAIYESRRRQAEALAEKEDVRAQACDEDHQDH